MQYKIFSQFYQIGRYASNLDFVRIQNLYIHQDGEVNSEEFATAVKNNCTGKAYNDLPPAFKAFITGLFKSVDVDGMWPLKAKLRAIWLRQFRHFWTYIPKVDNRRAEKRYKKLNYVNG